LKTNQLSYWYRKFEHADVPQAATLAPSNFVPVTMSEESQIKDNNTPPNLTLQFPNGVCLTGIQLSNIEIVQALLKVL
ncbi:IS66 family insertion sequence element accessory protein TnpA, partial [Spartinivicinus marinus]